MVPAVILPPAPARKPRRPTPRPAQPGTRAPALDRQPEAFPPPVLDALAADADWLAFCDDQRDGARDHQDDDPDAEWADLPEWMHHARDFYGRPLERGYGEIIGAGANGRPLWRPWPQGEA